MTNTEAETLWTKQDQQLTHDLNTMIWDGRGLMRHADELWREKYHWMPREHVRSRFRDIRAGFEAKGNCLSVESSPSQRSVWLVVGQNPTGDWEIRTGPSRRLLWTCTDKDFAERLENALLEALAMLRATTEDGKTERTNLQGGKR